MNNLRLPPKSWIAISIFCLFKTGTMYGQIDSKGPLISDLSSCRFLSYSLELTDEGLKVLEIITQNINREIIKHKSRETPIIISTYYCEEESEFDKFIGLKRAKIILDHLVEHTDLGSDCFLIRDYDVRYKGNYSQAGCRVNNVTIYY